MSAWAVPAHSLLDLRNLPVWNLHRRVLASSAHSFAIALVAGIFMVLHELASCFFWCSLTAW